MIFTAGEDGVVRAWRMPAEGGGEERAETETERPKKKKKKRTRTRIADGASEVGRYKPY